MKSGLALGLAGLIGLLPAQTPPSRAPASADAKALIANLSALR